MIVRVIHDPKGDGWAVEVNGDVVGGGMTYEEATEVVKQTIGMTKNAEVKPVSRDRAREIFGYFNDWPQRGREQ